MKPEPLVEIIGESRAIRAVVLAASRAAQVDGPVLLLGPTGVGKCAVATKIHSESRRADKPMVVINSAAIPENLLESELFGRERGAFTGAHEQVTGRYEAAEGGTLMLDEINSMP